MTSETTSNTVQRKLGKHLTSLFKFTVYLLQRLSETKIQRLFYYLRHWTITGRRLDKKDVSKGPKDKERPKD